VNVTRIGEKFIAMTETPIALEFDPDTLSAVGVFDPRVGVAGHITTAHPHYDYARKEGLNFITRVSRKSSYRVYRIPSGGAGKPELVGSIPTGTAADFSNRVASNVSPGVPLGEPAYMHSFGMTENYVVLAEYPFLLQLRKLLLGGNPFIESFEWKPERGTRFIVMDKRTGKTLNTLRTEPFFAFHHVNAFERENEVIVDIIAYDDASIIRSLYLDVLRGKSPGQPSFGKLRRYRLPTRADESPSMEVLSDEHLELPRINYRSFNAKEYRFVYAVGTAHSYAVATSLVKVDLQDRTSRKWAEDGCFPGEAVFLARPNATSEDNGIALSVVLDSRSQNSFLLILDSGSFEEIARARVPHHIPFGFHGNFFDGGVPQ
jgi:beta,beta-carotene 9',10'-dioxygenase